MGELLSVDEAQRRLLKNLDPTEIEEILLQNAHGRVMAEFAYANTDLPPFANSSMDGFAVKAMDLALASEAQPILLEVVGDLPAGSLVDVNLQKGQAIRIMTGAVLPAGADAVVPVEFTDFRVRHPGTAAPSHVSVNRPVELGENVRPQGQDIHQGDLVLERGCRLRPQEIGLLAMLGKARVKVYHQPRVAIFSTGDELLEVDQPILPGKIHDSNSFTLTSLINNAGGYPINLGIVPDNLESVETCLEKAFDSQADLILSSAGVSVGAFDFVRSAVEQRGKLDFWKVNMRPGKPLVFGHYLGVPFIGLPGNPVSAFIGFEVFVRPAILKLGGVTQWERRKYSAITTETIQSDGRESYLRARVDYHDGEYRAKLTGHQGSGNLLSLVQANALLIIPSGVKSLPSRAKVDFWFLE